MHKEIKNWLAMAHYDLITAKRMLESRRFVYVIFMCHLAIEKALKAIVSIETKKVPPKTHDLIYLVSLGKVHLHLGDELLDYIGKINNASVVTRYPEDLKSLIKNYPKKVAEEYFTLTQKVFKCLKQDKRLKL